MSKLINKLFLLLALFNLSLTDDSDKTSPPEIYNDLLCGEENSPKKPKDCTKYGTGSGFVCCWISDSASSGGKCRLVPDSVARDYGISGTKLFSNAKTGEKYWDCGNDASQIFFKFANILLFLIIL